MKILVQESGVDKAGSVSEIVLHVPGLKSTKNAEAMFRGLLVLLCHKRREQQNGQQASWLSRDLARRIRSVAMEFGLCRSARMRCAARVELGRNFRGA